MLSFQKVISRESVHTKVAATAQLLWTSLWRKPLEWVYEPHKQPSSFFMFQFKLYTPCVMNIPVLCHLIPTIGTGLWPQFHNIVSKEPSFHCDRLFNQWGERIFLLYIY